MADSRAAQELLARIRQAVAEDRYEISIHADNRIEERGMMVWQVASSLHEGTLLEVEPNDRPWPSVLVSQFLPDGAEVYAKWSYRSWDRMARLVTIYHPD